MDLSTRAKEMPNTPIRKFNRMAIEAEKAGKKIYRLNIGQPDIKTPECFNESIKNALPEILAYTESEGNVGLLDVIADYFKNFDANYTRDDIILTNGGSEALILAFQAVLDPGDHLLVPEPFYTNYQVFLTNASADIDVIRTKPEDGYRYATMEQLEDGLTDKTKAICINSPNNPTGVTLNDEEIDTICEFAKKHDLWIISDETYREFVFDNKKITSFASRSDYEERIIIVDSISKRFSACGARIGYLISKNDEIMDFCLKVAQGRLCVPFLEQIGAESLYRLPQSFYKKASDRYEARRDAVIEELSKINGVQFIKPDGAFYITLKLPVDNAEDFLVYLLQEFEDKSETVMFSPAEGFYQTEGLGKSEIRLAYVLNKDDMRRAVELIGLGLKSYKERG